MRWGYAGAANHSHTHTGNSGSCYWNTSSSSGGNLSGSGTSISSVSDSRPPWRDVIYIMAPEEPSAGGNVGMFGANF